MRYIHGVPEGIDELFVGKSLPLESNMDLNQGVDFRKGCYLGQELTIRTYHTGVTRKRIMPIQLSKPGHPPASETVLGDSSVLDRTASLDLPPSGSNIVNEKGRVVGKFCSGIHNIGLALLRLEEIGPHDGQLSASNGLLVSAALKPGWWSGQTV